MKIMVLGAGTMGAGIAQTAARLDSPQLSGPTNWGSRREREYSSIRMLIANSIKLWEFDC